jgi:nitrogen PTS system EIIA component
MMLADILAQDRVNVVPPGDASVRSKDDAIRRLSELLAKGESSLDAVQIEELLRRREEVQSTGVGGGVAIPHALTESVPKIVGALLLCPQAIGFDAIDGEPVSILVAVIGPKRETGEHIKTLARVSRLLRSDVFRGELLGAPSGAAAYELITREEVGGA